VEVFVSWHVTDETQTAKKVMRMAIYMNISAIFMDKFLSFIIGLSQR
jgi:hypothetical protein